MSVEREQKGSAPAPHADEADTALLERIRAGDRAALHALYTQYYQPLLRFTFRLTRQLEFAQEIINDVMLAVWQDARAFEGRSKVSTWILGIAYRMSIRRLQRARQWQTRFAAGDFEMAVERVPAEGELSDQAELADWLEHGLAALPAEQRAVVELTYFFGCSYAEIATILDCPENTVKTRMFHARSKLRAALPRLGKGRRS